VTVWCRLRAYRLPSQDSRLLDLAEKEPGRRLTVTYKYSKDDINEMGNRAPAAVAVS
jgi:hypothetical protein